MSMKIPNLKFYLDIFIHHKDITVETISDFLKVHIYLQLQVDNFCTVNSKDHKKYRSVKSFKLTCMISEIQAFTFIYF